MPCVRRLVFAALLLPLLLLLASARAHGQSLIDTMCDPSFQDCRATLLNYIRTETQSIDVAMWFMEDQEMADAIVERFRNGVSVRALVDSRRNTTTPMNAVRRRLTDGRLRLPSRRTRG